MAAAQVIYFIQFFGYFPMSLRTNVEDIISPFFALAVLSTLLIKLIAATATTTVTVMQACSCKGTFHKTLMLA